MTTGRINQVTIVRRGWPTGAVFHAPERLSKLLVGALAVESAARREVSRQLLGQVRDRPAANPLSPSSFPRTVRPHALCARCGQCGLGVPGGGLSKQLQPLRRPLPVVDS
jgi:hypothetical protein